MPLAAFLKSFFASNKKYGSKDRKQVSHLCYCFYRTGKMLNDADLTNDEALKEYITAALFLCSIADNEILSILQPQWNAIVHLTIAEKCKVLSAHLKNDAIHLSSVFPWQKELSKTTDYVQLCESFFIQPDVFLRVRPGYKNVVEQRLIAAELPYHFVDENCAALPPNTNIQPVLQTDKEAVVQDYSSQRVAGFFKGIESTSQISVWDCCTASGGKSILAVDYLQNISLTVSDIRPSILHNLAKRFANAGIKNYRSFVADLADEKQPLSLSAFNLIICDAPCSGSGTWGRTPEQLFYFNKEEINRYHQLQKKILQRVMPYVQHGGYLLYITCSVFKSENEDIVKEIISNETFELKKMEVLKGYDKKADTMFTALLQKK